ncbi:MAG: Clp protease N-terminal domain-containing protein [Anaerolineales bacterium]
MTASFVMRAFSVADRFGQRVVSEEHLLLAVIASAADELDLPVNIERIEAAVASVDIPETEPEDGVHAYAKDMSRVEGRAVGLALETRFDVPSYSHMLVAVLWDPGGVASTVLRSTGASRRRVLDSLGTIGGLAPTSARVNPLVRLARGTARATGDSFVCDQHVLLALLGGAPDPLAKEFLNGIGVTSEGVRAWYEEERRRWGPGPYPAPEEPAPSPACRALFGRAEGWAARSGTIGSLDGLVAYLWRPSGANFGWLGHAGTTLADVSDGLAAHDVRVPATALLAPDEPDMVRFALPSASLSPVLDALTRTVPPEAWDFNWRDDDAWIDVVAGSADDARLAIQRVLTSRSTDQPGGR